MQRAQPTQQEHSHYEGTSSSGRTLLDLDPLDYQKILSLLHPKDLCAAVHVCRALAAAGDNDLVWRFVACSRWPADSVGLGDSYKSYRELTLDDNRQNTVWYYPLEPGTSCTYIHSHDDSYYKCHLIGLERPRDGSQGLRVYYDARGESDLRPPNTSMLLLEMRLGASADNALVLTAVNLDEGVECVSKPGHYKGYLVWKGVHAQSQSIEAALAIERDDAGTEAVSRGWVFHYGCSPPGVAGAGVPDAMHLMVDYTGAQLFSVQRGQAVMVAKGAVERQLADEGPEQQRERWADLPLGVKARGSAWPGADGFGEWPKKPAETGTA